MPHSGAVIHWAHRYDWLLRTITLGREKALRLRMLTPAQLKQGEAVVDIGCGTGALAIAAAQMVGRDGSVTGVDPSPEMIQRAREKAMKRAPAVRFEIGFAQELPMADGTVDVVLSTVMLHHIGRDGRNAVLREVRRVLRPEGRLVAIDFGVDPGGKKGLLGHLHRHGGLAHRDLVALATSNGFRIEESGPLGRWDLQFIVARPSRD
jgi:demethylmenaquinone methyltransferase/2-methoxy-6-polyprenyl-1,4-benzoquinol methylase/phosphoethanolamine N-methyltransferase